MYTSVRLPAACRWLGTATTAAVARLEGCGAAAAISAAETAAGSPRATVGQRFAPSINAGEVTNGSAVRSLTFRGLTTAAPLLTTSPTARSARASPAASQAVHLTHRPSSTAAASSSSDEKSNPPSTSSSDDFIKDTEAYHDPGGSNYGQMTWNLIWDGVEQDKYDPQPGEEMDQEWECDLTGGAIPNNHVNALLSNKAKWQMYRMHKDNPKECGVPFLASKYRIRQQRVIAIIALKEMEEAAIEAGEISADVANSVHEQIDIDSGATYGEGSGERAFPFIQTYPIFEYVSLEDAASDPNSGKDPVEVLRAKMAREHETTAVAEFHERIDFNMKRVGTSLRRGKRIKKETHAGVGSASILIKPLGKDSAGKGHQPWVATPGGEKRSLTPDEALLIKRKTPKPRRKTLW